MPSHVPRIHGPICTSRYGWALDLTNWCNTRLSLSVEDNGTSLHKDLCDLATSYQFCLHLDSSGTCAHT